MVIGEKILTNSLIGAFFLPRKIILDRSLQMIFIIIFILARDYASVNKDEVECY